MEYKKLLYCPRDQSILTQCGRNIAAFRCPNCNGILLDLEKSKSVPMKSMPERSGGGVGGSLACPVSGSLMSMYYIYGAEVDYCSQSKMAWLDANEYEIISSNWLKENTYEPRQPIDKDKIGAGEVLLQNLSNFLFSTLLRLK